MAEQDKKAPPITDEIALLAKDQDIFTGWVDHLQNPDPTVLSEGQGKGMKLYDEVDRDPHAGSVLQTRYLSVAGEKWEITAGEDSARGKEIADFVTATLSGCNFKQAVQELLQGILYGFYCAEIMWTIKDGRIGVGKIIGKHPRRFTFTFERELRLLTTDNAVTGEAVPDRKFIVFSYGDSDNPYGKGLGQKLWWSVWFKKHGIKFWLIFLDKFGMPTGVGKYAPGATPDQKKTLREAIEAIHAETGVTIPDTMSIDLLEASRSGNVTYETLCEYMDKQISKAVLGQTLTTEVSGGSYAASKTHDDVRMDIKDADAGMVAECLNRSLIPWLVDYNFAGVNDYPTIRFITEKEEVLKEQADRDEVLVNKIGVQVDDDYWYDTYHLPRPKGGAAVVKPAKVSIFSEPQPSPQGRAGLDDNAALFDWAKQLTAGPAASLIDAAEALLNKVDSLEQFRDRLIDLYAVSEPEHLAEVMARLELLGNMSGRVTVIDEQEAADGAGSN